MSTATQSPPPPPTLYVYTDGSAKPNPGRGGYGYVLIDGGRAIEGRGVYCGDDAAITNNVAEWRALIAGVRAALEYARRTGIEHEIAVRLDSEVVVKQVHGEYRCNDAKLRPYYEEAMTLIGPRTVTLKRHGRDDVVATRMVRLKHVLRDRNSLANDLANRAVDDRRDVELAVEIVPTAATGAKRQRS